jgi:hypothetical protein
VAPALAFIALAWFVLVGWLFWFTPMTYSGIRNGVPAVEHRAFSQVIGLDQQVRRPLAGDDLYLERRDFNVMSPQH